jgi:hypothetical protein
VSEHFTKEQAQEWLNALEQAHIEMINMYLCAHWAKETLNHIKATVFEEGNVYSFKTGQVIGGDKIKPWPDLGSFGRMRNFQEIGRALDHAIHQINILLPEGDK